MVGPANPAITHWRCCAPVTVGRAFLMARRVDRDAGGYCRRACLAPVRLCQQALTSVSVPASRACGDSSFTTLTTQAVSDSTWSGPKSAARPTTGYHSVGPDWLSLRQIHHVFWKMDNLFGEANGRASHDASSTAPRQPSAVASPTSPPAAGFRAAANRRAVSPRPSRAWQRLHVKAQPAIREASQPGGPLLIPQPRSQWECAPYRAVVTVQ